MKRITRKGADGSYELAPGYEIFSDPGGRGIGLTQIVGRYEDLEEKLGLPLDVWIYLMKYKLSTLISYANDTPYPDDIYVENTIDDEEQRERFMKVNGRPQRFILGIDFEKRVINLQGLEKWTKDVPFSDYGKTWLLAGDELSRMARMVGGE